MTDYNPSDAALMLHSYYDTYDSMPPYEAKHWRKVLRDCDLGNHEVKIRHTGLRHIFNAELGNSYMRLNVFVNGMYDAVENANPY